MKIMEIIWLITGFSALGAGIHAFVHHDMKKSIIFFIMVVISFSIFTLRVRMRRMNDIDNNDPSNPGS